MLWLYLYMFHTFHKVFRCLHSSSMCTYKVHLAQAPFYNLILCCIDKWCYNLNLLSTSKIYSLIYCIIKITAAVRICTSSRIIRMCPIIYLTAAFEIAILAALDKNNPFLNGTYVETGEPFVLLICSSYDSLGISLSECDNNEQSLY